jgi:hypothetical protein
MAAPQTTVRSSLRIASAAVARHECETSPAWTREKKFLVPSHNLIINKFWSSWLARITRKGSAHYYFPSEQQKPYCGVNRRLLKIMQRRKKDSGLRRLVEDTPVPPDCRFFA